MDIFSFICRYVNVFVGIIYDYKYIKYSRNFIDYEVNYFIIILVFMTSMNCFTSTAQAPWNHK